MTDAAIDVTEDMGRATLPADASVASLSTLAIELKEAQERVDNLVEALAKAQDRVKWLAETLIPDQMTALGMSEFKLSDGSAVTIKKFVAASIPKERTSEALAWLESEGHAEIIKAEVRATFGAGETDAAQAAADALKEAAGKVELKRTVHPQTLAAFVREIYEDGGALPDGLFSVYFGRRATIK